MRSSVLPYLSLVVSMLACHDAAPASGQALGVPPKLEDGLEVAAPETVGLRPAPLLALPGAVKAGAFPNTTSVLLAKDGRLVFEMYFGDGGPQVLNDTRSAMKSVTALAVGAALADGALKSVDEFAFTRLADLGPFENDGRLKRGITLADFLTMSSALDCDDNDEESPGNEENMYPLTEWARWAVDLPVKADYRHDATGRGPFAYCTAGVFLLGQIVQHAVAEDVDLYIERRLLDPLGISEAEWPRSPIGEVMTGGGLRLRSRDLLKLGLLVLDQGRWNGKQLIPADWVERSLTVQRTVDSELDYGQLFWRRDFRTPCGTVGGWYMSGNGGNAVVQAPDDNLVAVVTRRHYGQSGMHQQTRKLLEEHVFAALTCDNDND